MPKTSRILVVDDSLDMANLIEGLLENEGFAADVATGLGQARQLLGMREYDALLVDQVLGDEDGTELLSETLAVDPSQSIIIMTAHGTIEKAVDSLKRGAFGYLTKPFDNSQLMTTVRQACERSDLKRENRRLRGMLETAPPPTMEGALQNIIGTSSPMTALIDQVRQVAKVDSTVLITGESGTGKELIAKAIHELSPRTRGRFGAINCGAIPATLLESELFGHKRGAFTDARVDRKGLFESCNTGTVFLDEIGEMPIELQVKLLRVLQEREIVPLGSDKSVPVDVRIVTATNKNLREEIRRGKFREDLYFRINVIPLHVPPLRERPEDIPMLTHHFLWQYSRQFDKKMEPVEEDLMRRLVAYYWPGNVRELQNNVERAVVMSNDGKVHPEHLFMDRLTPGGIRLDGPLLPYSEAKEEFEKSYLNRLLEAAGGNIAEAARLAGRYRADIYRLLHKYQLKSGAPPQKAG